MKKFSIILIAAGLLLSSCASKYGEQITEVNYYPNCYAPIAELRTGEDNVQAGTGAGAAIGAVMGALVGYATTGKAYGAIAGAAAGAAVGAVAGYGLSKHKSEADIQTRLANYAQAINSDTAQMDLVAASASQARQCYESAFNSARDDFKNKRITAGEFEARYKEIRNGLQETAGILNDVSLNMADKDQEYRDTLAWEASQRDLPAPDPQVYTVANAETKAKSKPSVTPNASPDPELDQMAKQTAAFKNSQAALEQERAATEAAINVFDQNAHDIMGIDA